MKNTGCLCESVVCFVVCIFCRCCVLLARSLRCMKPAVEQHVPPQFLFGFIVMPSIITIIELICRWSPLSEIVCHSAIIVSGFMVRTLLSSQPKFFLHRYRSEVTPLCEQFFNLPCTVFCWIYDAWSCFMFFYLRLFVFCCMSVFGAVCFCSVIRLYCDALPIWINP